MCAPVAIEDRKKLLSGVWLFRDASDEKLTKLAERAHPSRSGRASTS